MKVIVNVEGVIITVIPEENFIRIEPGEGRMVRAGTAIWADNLNLIVSPRLEE